VSEELSVTSEKEPYVVVAGFGLPGRSLVELLRSRGIKYTVIELNPTTCQRVLAGGVNIVAGDAADPDILRQAGVERATLIALMVPDDEINLRTLVSVRQLNPMAHVIARCTFTSSGFEAIKLGANQTIVAEQVVAKELDKLAGSLLQPHQQ
jgi:voltage-gated potassium channel